MDDRRKAEVDMNVDARASRLLTKLVREFGDAIADGTDGTEEQLDRLVLLVGLTWVLKDPELRAGAVRLVQAVGAAQDTCELMRGLQLKEIERHGK